MYSYSVKYDNIHKNGMVYTLVCIYNHIITRINVINI